MKRAPELAPLSREHHAALMLARHASTTDDPAAVRGRVLQQWTHQIAPHFDIEERVLLPALVTAGAEAQAGLAWRQHAHLRTLADRLETGDLAALGPWGDAMDEHVRFEERELFPLAERILRLGALGADLIPASKGHQS